MTISDDEVRDILDGLAGALTVLTDKDADDDRRVAAYVSVRLVYQFFERGINSEH